MAAERLMAMIITQFSRGRRDTLNPDVADERIKTQSVLPSVVNRRHVEPSCGSGFGYTPASHSRLVWPKLQL
jgi:hypothetical protein